VAHVSYSLSSQTHIIDWGVMALSAQIGYIVSLKSMLQLEKVKLMRKFTMLRVGNTYNKPLR